MIARPARFARQWGRRIGVRGDPEIRLPSLFRFLFVLAMLAALVYGGMVALVAFVQVEPREITQIVHNPQGQPQ